MIFMMVRRRGLGHGACLAALIAFNWVAAAPIEELTTVAQIRKLTPDEADLGFPVRLQAVVTFNRPDEFLLFVQDRTAGIYIFTDRQPDFRAGQLLEVKGVTSRGDLRPMLTRPTFEVLGEGQLPPPLAPSVTQFLSGELDCQRVRLTGVVRRVSEQPDGMGLWLGVDGQLIEAVVEDPADGGVEPAGLVDARVTLTGVTVTTTVRGTTRVRLGLPTLAAIQVEQAAAPAGELPVEKIGDLRRRAAAGIPMHRVRVQGVVVTEWSPETPLRIRDETGTAVVRSSQQLPMRVGERVDAVGFVPPNWNHSSIRVGLEETLVTLIHAAAGDGAQGPAAVSGLITSLGGLRALERTEAAQGRPVRVRGTVTLYTRIWELFFLQDRTDAVFVQVRDPDLRLMPGQLVEVEGVTAPGDYAPILVAGSVRVVGPGVMPAAPLRNAEQLMSGREDCRHVEVVGRVRQIVFVDGVHQLHLDSGGGRIEAVVFEPEAAEAVLERLEDALIRVRAVCGALLNAKGQLTGVRLFLQNFSSVSVLQPGLADPFQLPVTGIGEFLRLESFHDSAQRQRIQGTVSFVAGNSVYLFDETGAVRVRSRGEADIQAEDLVDVVGYPAKGQPGPFLEDALFRRIGPGASPVPLELASDLTPRFDLDGRVVRLRGWLLTAARMNGSMLLTLQSEGPVFHAEIVPERAPNLGSLPVNSLLELTGVYSVLADEKNQPRGFKILLRNAGDVVLLQSAPWISVTQAVLGLSGLALAVVVVLGWVYVLRGRIRRHEERFRKAFQAAPMSLHMVTAGDGRIVDANDSFFKLWGYRPEEVIGRTEQELGLWEDAGDRAEAGASVASGQSIRDRESRLRTRSGELRSVLVSIERFKLEGEEGLLLLCHDITERLSLEAQLRQAQKMESVGRLAAGVAHDFNNLLTVIQGHAQMLLSEPNLPPGMADSLQLMEQSAIRGAGFTRQLLTFSRKQVVQRSAVDLQAVIRGMGDMLKRLLGEGIWLEIKGPPNLPPIDADPSMVEQMVMNLAVNARDAMPAGGTLAIELSLSDRSPAVPDGSPAAPELDDSPAEQWVVLSVSDSGVGMPREILPHIFDPFFTTKEVGKGTGLGLATVYGTVKQHSGRIEVDSAEGRGTTFRISFPASPPAAAAIPAAARSTSEQGQGEKVMVVEDEVSVRRLVTGLLQRRGFHVIEAGSGPEALRVWQQNWRGIDLLLSDMVMPGGISGLDLARNFRRERPDLPVILTSGYSENIIDADLQELERIAFLAKPFPPGELVRRIRECLAASTLPAPEIHPPGA